MKRLIKNDDIQIIYTEKQDIAFVIKAEQEQENAMFIGQWSYEQHLNALDDSDVLHLLVKNITGDNVGYIIMKGLNNPNDSIELMRIVITDKGLGYGKNAVSLIKKWCFEIQQAHRLWLDVREDNKKAQHVYETQGFVLEGMLRECIKVENSYKSLIVMSVLSQDYYGFGGIQ